MSATSLRLAELVRRYQLGDAADRLAELLDLLAADAHTPTTVTDPAQAVDVHLADSLTALDLPRVRSAGRIADIGSGAGFPGLPLAIALPATRLALVESNARKAEFIERARGAVGAENATVVPLRVEEWHAGSGASDIVTARAVARLDVLCEYAAPLLRPGGLLVAWKGSRDPLEESAGAIAAAELGLEATERVRTEPYAGSRDRHLYVYTKVGDTPSRYPRRPGMASKRPLGGLAQG